MNTNGNEGGDGIRDFGVLHRSLDVAGSNPAVPNKLLTPEECHRELLENPTLWQKENCRPTVAVLKYRDGQILARLEELKKYDCCASYEGSISIDEDENGDYVKWDDIEKIIQELRGTE